MTNIQTPPVGYMHNDKLLGFDGKVYTRVIYRTHKEIHEADYEVKDLTTIVTIIDQDCWNEISNPVHAMQIVAEFVIYYLNDPDKIVNTCKLFAHLDHTTLLSRTKKKFVTAVQDAVATIESRKIKETKLPDLKFLKDGQAIEECEDGFYILDTDKQFVRYLTSEEEQLIQ